MGVDAPIEKAKKGLLFKQIIVFRYGCFFHVATLANSANNPLISPFLKGGQSYFELFVIPPNPRRGKYVVCDSAHPIWQWGLNIGSVIRIVRLKSRKRRTNK